MILFLDIDGVLTSARVHNAAFLNGSGNGVEWCVFDPIACRFIDQYCQKGNLSIVISSDWRIGKSRDYFYDLFATAGYFHMANALEQDYCTIQMPLQGRGAEIKEWRKRNKSTSEYIILDDNDDIEHDQKNLLIKTDYLNGMMYNNYVEFFSMMENEL